MVLRPARESCPKRTTHAPARATPEGDGPDLPLDCSLLTLDGCAELVTRVMHAVDAPQGGDFRLERQAEPHDVALEAGPGPFVQRDVELVVLRDHVQRVARDVAHLWSVSRRVLSLVIRDSPPTRRPAEDH